MLGAMGQLRRELPVGFGRCLHWAWPKPTGVGGVLWLGGQSEGIWMLSTRVSLPTWAELCSWSLGRGCHQKQSLSVGTGQGGDRDGEVQVPRGPTGTYTTSLQQSWVAGGRRSGQGSLWALLSLPHAGISERDPKRKT